VHHEAHRRRVRRAKDAPRADGSPSAAERLEGVVIGVLVCDDSDEARAALRTMLADHAEIAIVGEAANGREAIELALEEEPDVVLMDVRMPLLDGVEATREITRLVPRARIVAFSGIDDEQSVDEMLSAGAAAYCVKGAPLWELERAIAGGRDPLVRLAHGLARASNRVGIGTIVSRELVELIGAEAAVAYLAAPDVALSLAGCAGPVDPEQLLSAPGVALRAFATLSCAFADRTELDELEELGLECSQALAAPLISDGETLGSVLVAMPPDGQLRADEAFVSDIAALAASAFAAERRLALTHAEARRDALTGLANRRALDERLDEAVREATARQREVSVAVFDLDDFKRINDEGGHAAGDEVLRQVGRAAGRVLRPSEELFRIGGDEFAVVVPAGATTALEIADRIQVSLGAQRRGCALPSISAGVAGYPADGRTKDELLRAADAALYASKRAGKRRASLSPQQVTPGPSAPTAPPWSRGAGTRESESPPRHPDSRGARVLFVDDDAGLLALLRATFELVDIEISEARTGVEAAAVIAAEPPDVVVLDIGLPDISGLSLCRRLKGDPATSWIGVVLLTGAGSESEEPARAAGADAFLRKPFSPLELLAVVERLAGGLYEGSFHAGEAPSSDEQLLLYANDLRRLLEIERGRQELLQRTYRQTVAALAGALESKDVGTASHSQRVQRYAVELARALDPALLDHPSVEYGFLLHDVGKIGIPDRILQKRGPLDEAERQLMRSHTVLGEQMLSDVHLLHGEGLKIVRGHHERWDGMGYPDRLAGEEIPLAARVFTLADALDAITSDRPYRAARSWDEAAAEILSERGRQFDPDVVDAFREREEDLREIGRDLALA
jgi:ribonuclease P protein subunit RPR2